MKNSCVKNAAMKLMARHISPTVAHIIAVSNRTGCVSLGANTLVANLKEHGLPIMTSKTYADIGQQYLDRVNRIIDNK